MLTDLAKTLPLEKADWDEYFFSMALMCTSRADCTRRQVGCVAVSPDKRVVSTGYNAPPKGEESACEKGIANREEKICCKQPDDPPNSGYDKCNALHAEMNALDQLGSTNHYEYVDLYLVGRDGRTGELIDIGHPCILCSRMIKNFNIRHIKCLKETGEMVILDKSKLRTTA
jgi:dCMP deaminase